MLGIDSSNRIVEKLKALRNDPGLDLVHAEAWTGINNGTLSKILRGKSHKMRTKTAIRLASYIEHITDGECKSADLLTGNQIVEPGKKIFTEQDLSGVNFSGQDLEDAVFTKCTMSNVNFFGSNLKNAVFDGIHSGYLKFCGANTDGVVIKNSDIHRWDLRGTRGDTEGSTGWDGAIIENSKMLGFCHGVDWRNAKLRNVQWKTGSGHSYGLRLALSRPQDEIIKGFDNPEVVSFLIELHAQDDLELLHIAWKIRARAISRCWVGFVEDLEKYYPTALKKLMVIFKDYPGWSLCERVDLAFAMIDCKTLDDWLALRKRKDYRLFKWPIENEIKKFKTIKSPKTPVFDGANK